MSGLAVIQHFLRHSGNSRPAAVLTAIALILLSWAGPALPGSSSPALAALPADAPSRIVVVDDSSYAPFSFLDHEGRPAGITIDIWNLWSRKTGIKVEFRLMKWEEALRAVRNGRADAVGSLFRTVGRLEYFDFTRPFLSIATGVFFHQQIRGVRGINDLHGFMIGVVSGDSAEELLASKYPQIRNVGYDGAEALIRAAVAGEIKAFVLDEETARFYLAKHDLNGVYRQTTDPLSVNTSHSAVKKGNTALLAVIQYGFDRISEEEIAGIVSHWAGRSVFDRVPWGVVGMAAAAGAVLLFLFLLWNVNLRKKVATALQDVEERNQELLRSEARLRAFFDLAPFGCIVNDLEGRFVMANQAFYRRVGLREDQVIGRTGEEIGLFFGNNDPQGILTELLRNGEVANRELIISAPSGLRHILYYGRTLELGGQTLILSATVDITDRKRAEEALKDSEDSFTRLFDSAPIPMAFASDVDGFRATTWNRSWYQVFGYTREEADGRSGAEIGLWVDPQDRQKLIGLAQRDNFVERLVVQLRRRDGAVRHCELFGRFIGKTGRQVLMIAYIDITDRLLADRAMRESEERFSKAFASSPAPMVISEIDSSRFIDFNTNWLKMVGYTREELFSSTALELGIWKDPEERKEIGRRLRRDGFIKDFRAQVVTASGEIRDVIWSAEIVNIGGQEAMLSLVYDYTDGKRAAEEREKLQLQLLQAQKMESVGRLAGGVAHDYNNMLGVIIGHTELAMMKSGTDHPLQGHLEEIMSAARRSADLTQQLLAFARRQTIAPKVMMLGEAVESTLQMLRWLIGENIELEFLPGAEHYPVKVDPSQLDQILVNLCVNARDAIDGIGRISIEIGRAVIDEENRSTAEYMLPGEYVTLTVSDNGSGMDRETQAKIFEPFFTTKGIGQGTGLGLATVYGIVKQNDGFINVYSEPGHGTTFKIYLPWQSDMTPAGEKGRQAVPAARGETILVVEDETVLLEINSTMLRDLGYRVLPANAPSVAIRLAAEHAGEIDLLITDVVMPEMNGRELEQQVRRSNPDIACLYMSGYTANIISHHGVLDQGVHFLQKPFTMNGLAEKVGEALKEKRMNGAPSHRASDAGA